MDGKWKVGCDILLCNSPEIIWILTFLHFYYSKCFKILITFLVLFLAKMVIIKAEIHKMLVRIANREDPDQTASSEAV